MGKALLGVAVGVGLSVLGILVAMCGGEEFRTTVLKHGVEENGTGVVATDRFVILFDGVPGDDAGASVVTYAGRHGALPALWSGYGSGWGAGERGITSFHTYDPYQGQALLFYFGKLIMVEESGRFLRVQDGRFPLGDEVAVVSVDADGFCKPLADAEARDIYETLPSWYKDGVVSGRAPRPRADNEAVSADRSDAPAVPRSAVPGG